MGDRLHKVRFDEMEGGIRGSYIEHGVLPPNDTHGIDWKTLNFAPPESIKEIQELAKIRNVECLSKNYFGNEIKLKWKCYIHNYKRGGYK